MEIRLPYIASDVDRHGNPRFYVRKRGCPNKIRINATPGSPEFLKAYENALQAIRTGNYPKTKQAKGKGLYDAPRGDRRRRRRTASRRCGSFLTGRWSVAS
jgi:hypothetical protein